MSGVEIDLGALGDSVVPGLRAELGLDEMRDGLLDAHGQVHLHVDAGDPADARGGDLYGVVESVGAGVVRLHAFGDDEDQDTLVPLTSIVWAKVRRRA